MTGAAGGGAGCEQNTDAIQEPNRSPSGSRRFMKLSPLLWIESKSRLTILKGNLKLKGE